MGELQIMPTKKQTCIVRIKTGNEYHYLKNLVPVEWSQFISDSIIFNAEFQARDKLWSRNFQLSENLPSSSTFYAPTVSNIEIATYIDGKYDYSVPYIVPV